MIALYIIAALLFLFIVYLLLIAPRCIHRADMSKMTGWIYAHRGMHTNPEIPENSMPAFRLAVEHGYGIELDLHLSTDGKVFIIHDAYLDRICGIDGKTDDLSYDEVTKLRLFGTEEQPPMFTDFLKMVDGKVPLIIELKGRSKNTALADAAAEILKDYKGEYCIESFNPLLIRRWRQLNPKDATGLLMTYYCEEDEKKYRFFNTFIQDAICRPDFIAYNKECDKNLIFRLIRSVFNPYTAAWTIRNREDFVRCRREYDMPICEKLGEIHEAYEDKEDIG